MADLCISARGLTLAFEPHPPIFSALEVHLFSEPVALIGANGVGKTLLAECLAGVRNPQEGCIEHQVPVAFLPQQAVEQEYHQSVAAFLGVEVALQALQRLLAGEGRVDDLSILEDRWTLQEDLQAELSAFQLEAGCLSLPVSALSGGQRTRLHLLKLSRLSNTYLILDEPTSSLYNGFSVSGISCALYVPQVGIINPSEFSPIFSIEIVLWVALGGRATLYGAVIGALLVNYAKTYFTGVMLDAWLFALGGLFVLVTVFLPKGIAGLLKQRKQQAREKEEEVPV